VCGRDLVERHPAPCLRHLHRDHQRDGLSPSDLHIEGIASRASFALPEITAGVLEAERDVPYEEMVRRMEV
jgi:hypothetical protein